MSPILVMELLSATSVLPSSLAILGWSILFEDLYSEMLDFVLFHQQLIFSFLYNIGIFVVLVLFVTLQPCVQSLLKNGISLI